MPSLNHARDSVMIEPMPELPDIEAYLAALRPRMVNERIIRIRIASPFLVRTVDPPIESIEGRLVLGLRRMGKRIVFELEGEHFLILHLMIAGRLRWQPPGNTPTKPIAKIGLAVFDFPSGVLQLTEAGTKRRASLHLVMGEAALSAHDPGGIDPMCATLESYSAALRRENHTVKRSLTDPRLFAGIGNAYSDEILHAARLSPVKLTRRLTDEEVRRLHDATVGTLRRWTDELTRRFVRKFPGAGDVTAFRPDFAVHGRFHHPCPDCGTLVQRIRYAENETNYCPRCQNGGRILADRSLSRLLREDWPRTIDELDEP